MEVPLENIREQQKATWNKFSSGWEKWNAFTMDFLRPMGESIIDFLHIKKTDLVLDIATGTGEPGLTIAGIATEGRVTATDLSEDMLVIASKTALARNLTNFETVTADCCELPFPDNHFDAVSCRMGFMFFPDMQLAADEMFRVLKPGGRMATSVWGIPEDNPWVTKIMGVLALHIEMPAPQPGAPGMFRCSQSGLMTGILLKSGFKDIQVKSLHGKLDYQTPERFWQNMTEVAAPVVNTLLKADENTREIIHQDVLAMFRDQQGKAVLDYGADVYYGEKPEA